MIRVAGHFGELLQGRLGDDLALISLPCDAFAVTLRHRPAKGLHVFPPHLITPDRARRFLADLGLNLAGRVTLHADMPLGGGAGSSTAALVGLARLAGWQGTPDALARACLRAEGASDPLMMDRPAQLLWASRKGRVLAQLPPLPAFDILGGFFGPPQRTNAADFHFPDISDLLPAWIATAKSQDLAGIARLSSISAKRTLTLRGPADDPIFALARSMGALGVVIAHTGTARGLIFGRGQIPMQGVAALRGAGMTSVITFAHRTLP